MAKTATLTATEEAKTLPPGEGWYHYGMLPALGKVLFPHQAPGERAVSMHEFDAAALYFGDAEVVKAGLTIAPEEPLPIFVAQYRQRTSVGVRGCVFPCVSENVEWQAGECSKSPFPGNVMRATGEEVAAIVKSAYRHFVRFKFGVEKMGRPDCQTEEWDMATGEKPSNMTEAQWIEYQGRLDRPIVKCPAFNPRTDKLVADLVYCTPLDADLRGFDEEQYLKNPNKFHYRLIGPMTREFFTEPPKSIAQLYLPEGLLK